MDPVADRMITAARAWLDSLDGHQRERARWAFPGDDERRRWFYTPTDHGGLPIREMGPTQQQLAMALLASGLSRAGYVTVATIMGLENILDHAEGWRMAMPGRERTRDPGMYYVRVFGEPGPTGAWSWRFGGHHVSLHHLVVNGEVRSSTPCFMGADPASAPLLGPHLLRPLGAVEDLGRELLRSLDEGQTAAAVISSGPPIDVVGGNRPQVSAGDGPMSLADVWRDPPAPRLREALDARTRAEEAKAGFGPDQLEAVRLSVAPKGIAATRLAGPQHEILRALLDTYLGRMPDELAEAESAKYEGAGIERLHFAWAGGAEPGQPHYYRIEGPRLLVEYDNTQNDVNHVHSVWRDPEGDFGVDVLGKHLRHDH